MAYVDLTDQQKADIALYDKFLRGLFSTLAQAAKNADADNWNQFAVDNVDGVLGTLLDSDVIPNSTGLGGSKDLTVAEFKQLQSIARQLKSMLEANRVLLVKAVGVNA